MDGPSRSRNLWISKQAIDLQEPVAGRHGVIVDIGHNITPCSLQPDIAGNAEVGDWAATDAHAAAKAAEHVECVIVRWPYDSNHLKLRVGLMLQRV